MNWLEDIWTMHRKNSRTRVESWDWVIFRNDGIRIIKKGSNSWNASDGWKEFSQSKTIMRGWHKLELWIFKRMDQDLREILLRSSRSENDDEEHHHELLRYSGRMKSEGGWANDEKNLKDLEEIHMTDDNSFLRQTLEDLRITPRE